MKQESLKDIAKRMLVTCLGAKAGEQVLVVTDDTRLSIGQGIYAAAQELGCEAMLMQMAPRKVAGAEPPAAVARAMQEADIVICPTAKSLTHTNARIKAVEHGARVATMPGITEEMFYQGAITADYEQVKRMTETISDMLTKAKTARIVKEGCELTIQLSGRNGVISSGVYRNPGGTASYPEYRYAQRCIYPLLQHQATKRGKTVSPVVTSGCPKRSEDGCPCRNEGVYRFPLNW